MRSTWLLPLPILDAASYTPFESEGVLVSAKVYGGTTTAELFLGWSADARRVTPSVFPKSTARTLS